MTQKNSCQKCIAYNRRFHYACCEKIEDGLDKLDTLFTYITDANYNINFIVGAVEYNNEMIKAYVAIMESHYPKIYRKFKAWLLLK